MGHSMNSLSGSKLTQFEVFRKGGGGEGEDGSPVASNNNSPSRNPSFVNKRPPMPNNSSGGPKVSIVETAENQNQHRNVLVSSHENSKETENRIRKGLTDEANDSDDTTSVHSSASSVFSINVFPQKPATLPQKKVMPFKPKIVLQQPVFSADLPKMHSLQPSPPSTKNILTPKRSPVAQQQQSVMSERRGLTSSSQQLYHPSPTGGGEQHPAIAPSVDSAFKPIGSSPRAYNAAAGRGGTSPRRSQSIVTDFPSGSVPDVTPPPPTRRVSPSKGGGASASSPRRSFDARRLSVQTGGVGGGATSSPSSATSSRRASISARSPSSSSHQPSPTTTPRLPRYTMTQVRLHKSPSDCWAVIDGGVYNLTRFLASHPGGFSAILDNCGKDATSVFHSSHSNTKTPGSSILARLKGFQIGTLQH